MEIFKLVPRNIDHNDWRSSSWKMPVLVRSESENAARWAASLAFRIAVEHSPGMELPLNPWRQEQLSLDICLSRAEAEGAGLSISGPVEILEPRDSNEALAGINWDNI